MRRFVHDPLKDEETEAEIYYAVRTSSHSQKRQSQNSDPIRLIWDLLQQ